MIKISDTEYFSNDKTIRFLNMDCNVFMAGCKENEFDLNLSDPPYGIGANKMTLGNGKRKLNRGSLDWDNSAPSKDIFDNIIKTAKNQILWGQITTFQKYLMIVLVGYFGIKELAKMILQTVSLRGQVLLQL